MASPDRSGGERAGWLARRGAWLLLAVAIAGAAAIRLRLLAVPLERDEGEYAYAGQLILEGVAPFRMAYTMKLPGTSLAYAASMAAFGRTAEGIRLGLILVNAATSIVLFLLGRRLLGALGGLAAAVSFACLSLSTGVFGPFGHATHFVILPASAGILLLLEAEESGALATYFTSGLLLGVGTIMKQPGMVFPVFAATWLAWVRLRNREARRLLREGAVLAAGVLAPMAVLSVSLALAGVQDRFWFWVVRYAREYASSRSLAEGLASFREAAAGFLPQSAAFWFLSALGLVLAAWPRAGVRRGAFLLAFLAFSLAGVCAGLHFRGHYFILALPAVALLVGAAFQGLEHLAARTRFPGAAAPALVAVLALACAQAAWAQRQIFFRASPVEVSRALYGLDAFPESVAIARYLESHTGPDDRVAVLGSEPQIYFYSGRRSATGYIYMYGLMEVHPLARAMQQEMIREIEGARPAYVVFVPLATSWRRRPASETLILRWYDRYVVPNYEIVAQTVLSGNEIRYLWDADAARAPLGERTQLVVLRRRGFVPPSGD